MRRNVIPVTGKMLPENFCLLKTALWAFQLVCSLRPFTVSAGEFETSSQGTVQSLSLHCVDDHAAKSGLGPSPIRVLS